MMKNAKNRLTTAFVPIYMYILKAFDFIKNQLEQIPAQHLILIIPTGDCRSRLIISRIIVLFVDRISSLGCKTTDGPGCGWQRPIAQPAPLNPGITYLLYKAPPTC